MSSDGITEETAKEIASSLRRVVDVLSDISQSLDDMHGLFSVVALMAFPDDNPALERRMSKSYNGEES